MPKLYFPTPDELQGAKPLWEGGWGYDDNRGSWFHSYQELLVRLANTDYGRDLLCIHKYPYPVISMRKNMVQFDMSQDLGPGYTLADVRVGGKWSNVIRYRWLAVKKALDQMNLKVLLALPTYIIHEGRSVPVLKGAATTTVYPQPSGSEDATVDGEATVGGVTATWADIRGHAGTGAADDTAFWLSYILSSATTNRWEGWRRGIALFDTSGIGAGQTVVSATFQFTANVVNDPFTGSGQCLVTSAPASNTAIAAGDFDSLGTTQQADDIAVSAITADSSTYNSTDLNATGLGNIDVTGITKFGCIGTNDREDDEPTWPSSPVYYRVSMLASETSGTSKDPKLVIVHAAGFVARAMMF